MFNWKQKLFVLILAVIALAGALWWKSTIQQPNDVDIVIRNAKILTMNGNGDVVANGWIVIDNGTIIAIENGACCGNYHATKIIDAAGTIAMPGLINTHAHVGMTSLRNTDNSHTLKQWLENTGAQEKNFTEEEVYKNSKNGIEEMIRSGITTTNDMYFFPEQTIKAAEELGMRAMVRVPTLRDETGTLHIDQTFYNAHKDRKLLTLNLAPNPLTEYSLDELRWFSNTAKELQLPIHIHLAEDPSADQEIINKFGISPLELLKQSGLITNKLIIAHAVTFTAPDIHELAQYPNVAISFNPKSNYLLSDRTATIDLYLENNMAAGVGTDGAASGGTLDVLDQVRFAALVSRCISTMTFCVNQRQIAPYAWIQTATISGAKALGLENKIGSIEIGKQADIILVDSDNYESLVFSTDASDITHVFIAGNIVWQK